MAQRNDDFAFLHPGTRAQVTALDHTARRRAADVPPARSVGKGAMRRRRTRFRASGFPVQLWPCQIRDKLLKDREKRGGSEGHRV